MNITRKKASGIALLVASVMTGAFGFSLISPAQAATDYDAGFLLADANMYTAPKMSAEEIQKFLNDKGSNCRTGGGRTCLKDFKMKTMNYAADNYCPNGYVSNGVETAAQIIYKAAKACNIAPEVILVTLQKEQSLVTSPGGSWAYKATMGFNCPDNSPCANADFGFQHQIYRGARQFQVYRLNPGYFNFRGGKTSWVGYNPSASCGGTNVYMQTQATASLYNYTPYQPNEIVRKHGYVASNKCGTYGNYNFVNYYRQWFGDPKVVRAAANPVPAKPVENPKAKETGTEVNLEKQKTGPVKTVEPVSKPVAKSVVTIASVVVANTKIASGSAVVPNVGISVELVNLKPNEKPTLTLNGKVVENPGVANADGKLTVKLNTGTGPELVIAVQDNGKTVSEFKAKVVTEIKPTEAKPTEKSAPRVGAVTIEGKSATQNQQLRAGDEITLRIEGVAKSDFEKSTTELYFHSPEKVLISKNGKWENNAYVLNIPVPSQLSNGNHGIFISVSGKATKLFDFQVNNPPTHTQPAAKTAQANSQQPLADSGAEAGVVFVVALMMMVGGLYLVIGAQQNRPIRVNC